MKVSIIIPTYNEPFLYNALKSAITVSEREGLDYELIVVTSSEKPETWVKTFNAKLLTVPKHHVGMARNEGAKIASGDVLVFIDANSYIDRGLRSCAEYALEPRVGTVTAPAYVVSGRRHIRDAVGYSPLMDRSLEYIGWQTKLEDRSKPYPVMFPCGCFTVMERRKFMSLPTGYIPYFGYEDREIGFRLWRMGFENIGIPWASFGHLFRKETQKEKKNDPMFYKFWAKNYAIGSLLDFDDDSLSRLANTVLREKGVTPEMWQEIFEEGWLRIRDECRKLYVRDDTDYFLTFGTAPP
ncbi:MAG: glycosyltransferase family 2 protein [Thermofilaceae archaeon]